LNAGLWPVGGGASLLEQMASANDNLIGVVGMPRVVDVMEPSDVLCARALRPAHQHRGQRLFKIGSFHRDPAGGSDRVCATEHRLSRITAHALLAD
jgi:hypothetical protein